MQSHSKMRERALYCFGFKKEHDDKLGLNYLLFKTIEVKCWLPVNHVLLFSIPSVKTSGCHYAFPESELKDTRKQFT